MVTPETFINEIYMLAEQSGSCLEPEQQFPEPAFLEEVCRELLYASTMREEGRYSTFRVCFIEPDSAYLIPYLYSHAVLLDEPVPFSTKEIHRLAPAISPDISYLILNRIDGHPWITGMIVGHTTWNQINSGENPSGIRMPRIANLLVSGPGELVACLGESPLVSLKWGNLVHFRKHTFTSTLVAQVLKEGSGVSDANRAVFFSRILINMMQMGSGGHLFIVPEGSQYRKHVRIKYKLPVSFMFCGDGNDDLPIKTEKDLISYADMVSKLTAVDGGVLLNKNLDLLGFGVETLMDSIDRPEPDLCFINYDGIQDTTKRYQDYGMRHRSCFKFCSAVEGTVALIASHDGFIKACTQHDGKVVVYDNVSVYNR